MVGRLVLAAATAALALAASATAAHQAPVRDAVPGCTFRPSALATPGEGRPDPTRSLAAAGTLRVALLFVAPPGIQPSEDPQALAATLVAPTERWFDQASYGRARVDITPLPTWLPVRDTSVSAALAAAAGRLDATRYDAVAAVLPEETHSTQSHAEIVPGGTVRYGVVLAPHPTAGADRAPQLWMVLAHELGHVLGLPDLYAAAGDGAASVYAGPWDPMSQPLGQNLLAWHAWSLGWLGADSVACVYAGSTREARLTPLETQRGLKALLLPQGQSVVVVEARRRVGLDANLCADGVLVYSVQLDAVPKAAPIRVLGRAGTGACGPLSNAPLQPGQSLQVGAIRVDVLSGLRVRISR